MKRKPLLTAALSALLALLPALASAADAVREVRISTISYATGGKTSYSGVSGLIAQQGDLEKALAKRGVKLTWVPVSTAAVGPQINEAFANRRIDFAGYGDLPSVIANASGIRTKLLVPGGTSTTYLVVPANSTARSITDLKGKRIALHRGRPWEFPFLQLAQANRLGQNDFKLVNLNPQAGAAALSSGSVDAFFTLSDAWLLVDKGVGKIIWNSKQSPESWQMRAELWGASEFVAANPAISQLVVDAYVKAAHWASLEQNRDAYLRLQSASGLPESVLRRDYDGDATAWKQRASPLFTDALAAHYRDVARYAKGAKLTGSDVDMPATFEPRFVDAALKSLGLTQFWTDTKVARQ
ncbi:PhnD/SsuA/transferrin family substrate-binding protein [Jeongeupia chitinilytica]|uniref:Nitrate ABC transporter substrate-binding protein n=1 Tax=Jeongeupia chitinilytica TaxID=1041641 RepID=A0ABQ3H1I2_9NEIS|nr:PhnD/SsuA/transferrin family substrate-binding protein [Jeongeupia chitinilytica]GHD63946.1 nitrate ABC transporter substrate-binding protein [Jeongeupia chitinilytica]